MDLTWQQSIIVTLSCAVAWGAGGEGPQYYASSFEDLAQLVQQEIGMIQQLETYRDSIDLQLQGLRNEHPVCKVENKSSLMDISNTLPSHNDVIGGAIGLVYIQLYYDIEMRDIVEGRLTTKMGTEGRDECPWEYRSPHRLGPDDAALLARAAHTLGRLVSVV